MNYHFNPDGSIDFQFADGTIINSNDIDYNMSFNNEEITK